MNSFSRLTNLRERKVLAKQDENCDGIQFTTGMYQPSVSLKNTGTSIRMLKSRIQKPSSASTFDATTQNDLSNEKSLKLTLPPPSLKLVLNDQPNNSNQNIPPVKTSGHKRINIIKQKPISNNINQTNSDIQLPTTPEQNQQKELSQTVEKDIIHEEEVEQSKDVLDSQNQLIVCTEGCGRKFNRKALQKHVKACKVVFMSKRRQFNSEAKRITSKEHAVLLKQTKIKEKNVKAKQFDKTGEGWKVASQQFRAVIKAVKNQDGVEIESEVKSVACNYCQKLFNELFLAQHFQNCAKKKDTQKKLPKKKK